MSLDRTVWPVVALIVLGASQTHAMEHIGLSRSDEFLLCARGLFQKPVFRSTAAFRGPGKEIDIPCPSTREELMRELEGSGTRSEPEQIKSLEVSDVVFLYPSRLLYKADAWIRWRRLEIAIQVSNWDSIPGSRSLTVSEQAAVREAILREARMVPLVTPSMPGRDGETATIELFLLLDVHRLAPGSTESVVAILGESGGASRLIYGELRGGEYQVLWDSPLFSVRHPAISYEDMDGDGSAEILVAGDIGLGGQTALLVWHRNGCEFTRQTVCMVDGRYAITEQGGACPIAATSIEVDGPQNDGRRDLVVKGRVGDPMEVDPDRAFRYRLVSGRYIEKAAAKKESRKDASTPKPKRPN